MSCGKERHTKVTPVSTTCSKSRGNCVAEVVAHIFDMQEAIEETNLNTCPSGCLRPLGHSGPICPTVNTRPFILFGCDGDTFKAFTGFNIDCSCKTDVFRVESIDGNCATLRALAFKDTHQHDYDTTCKALTNPSRYDIVATNFCVTVDLTCFCGIQCLNEFDTYIRPC